MHVHTYPPPHAHSIHAQQTQPNNLFYQLEVSSESTDKPQSLTAPDGSLNHSASLLRNKHMNIVLVWKQEDEHTKVACF